MWPRFAEVGEMQLSALEFGDGGLASAYASSESSCLTDIAK